MGSGGGAEAVSTEPRGQPGWAVLPGAALAGLYSQDDRPLMAGLHWTLLLPWFAGRWTNRPRDGACFQP